MMTLSEAIEHAEWCAENSCGECADDHRQLAEWLKELRDIKSENASLKGAVQGLGELCDMYKAENDSLREYVDRLERHAIANAPTSCLEGTKARLNQMRRLCWLEERW